MNNQSTTTQPRLWTLILCLLLTIQTACTNGMSHLEADGDEEKFLKRLTREERSFWNSIKDEGFKAAFVEYCYEEGLNKTLSHLPPKDKDHFVEYVLEQKIENEKKSHIIYQYLEGNLSSRVGHILDHVQDTEKAKKFVKSLCDYLPKYDLQFIDNVFKHYEKESSKKVIQGYIASKKLSLICQTDYVLKYIPEDLAGNLEIIKGLWGQLYKDNKPYVDHTFNKPSLTQENIKKALKYIRSKVKDKVLMILQDGSQEGMEIICQLLKHNCKGPITKAVVVEAIKQSTVLENVEKCRIIHKSIEKSLLELSEEESNDMLIELGESNEGKEDTDTWLFLTEIGLSGESEML